MGGGGCWGDAILPLSSLVQAEEGTAGPSLSQAVWPAVPSAHSQLCLNHRHPGGEVRGWVGTEGVAFLVV